MHVKEVLHGTAWIHANRNQEMVFVGLLRDTATDAGMGCHAMTESDD